MYGVLSQFELETPQTMKRIFGLLLENRMHIENRCW